MLKITTHRSVNGQEPETPMKNNLINRFVTLSSAVLLLMIVLLYVIDPELAVSINRSLEMIKSGSTKGLMMIWYPYGDFAFSMAGLSWAMQLMICVFNNTAVSEACYGLFDSYSAKLILAIFGMIAMMCCYALGNGLRVIIHQVIRRYYKGNKEIVVTAKSMKGILEIGLMLLCMGFVGLNWSYTGILFYAFGTVGLDFRKAAATSLIGFLLFY